MGDLTEREQEREWVDGEAEHLAAVFIRDRFNPAIVEPGDGGLALMRAMVDLIFYDAAYHDAAGDLNIADELLDIAHRAINRGRAPAAGCS